MSKTFKENYIRPKRTEYSQVIETLAAQTNEIGEQPLWEGYGNNNIGGPTRKPSQVRTGQNYGNLYAYLVQERKPDIIVEFGTAFGVSGMYFLAGINENNKGELLTFEPNTVWANLAKKNLSQISDKFKLINGTFEENIDKVLLQNQLIDLAFIDAIHTQEFVIPQLDLVIFKASDRAVIILDDINFSDDMRECWDIVSTDSRFASSLKVGNRVGIVELK